MSTNYVAAADGVLIKVGDTIRSLYRDGALPEGADPGHVRVLVERGLLVEPDVDQPADAGDDPDGAGPMPAKSATRAEWDAYAKSEAGGSLTDDDVAAFSSKEDLQKHYGVS